MKWNGININTPTVWQYILLVAVFACIATAHIREKLRLSRFDSIVIVLRFPTEQMRKKINSKKTGSKIQQVSLQDGSARF